MAVDQSDRQGPLPGFWRTSLLPSEPRWLPTPRGREQAGVWQLLPALSPRMDSRSPTTGGGGLDGKEHGLPGRSVQGVGARGASQTSSSKWPLVCTRLEEQASRLCAGR